MADPRVYFDLKTKTVVRTDPPGLMKLLKRIEGTDLVILPGCVYDLGNNFKAVPVQVTRLEPKRAPR